MKKADVTFLLQRWTNSGLISPEQSAQLQADANAVITERSSHKFITAVMVIGALALSLGVLLVIASNWEYFGKTFKLVMALLLPVVPLCFAYYRQQTKGGGDMLCRASSILGMTCVGGTLALIAQIYNLEPNYVSFTWTWALLTFPFLFVFRRTEQVFFSAGIVGAALWVTLFDWLDNTNVEDNIAIIIVTATALAYAFLLYVIGSLLRGHQVWHAGARLLRLGASSIAIVTLFIMTFEEYTKVLTNEDSWRNVGTDWIPISIVLNLLFIGFLCFVLFQAFRRQEPRLGFNVVRVFAVYLIAKYITLFSEMLDTGVFMIIGGLLFIVGAWQLEKHKARLIALMQEEIGHNERSEYDDTN